MIDEAALDRAPLVSVIMPFRDTLPEFMREAIESVLGQTYAAWELLLVDDGSGPESRAIAAVYAERLPDRIRCLEHPGHENRGVSASRNLGLARASGKYMAVLDADDLWLPEKLEQQVALMETYRQAGMVYGNTLYWYSWTRDPGDRARDYVPDLGVPPNTLMQPPDLLRLFLQGKAAVPATCSILARREVAKSFGGFEDAFTGLFEDQAFYAKICLAAPVFAASACWDRYRRHSASICAGATAREQRASRRAFLDWLEVYLRQKEIDDPGLWQVLRRQQWEHRHRIGGRLLRTSERLGRRAGNLWRSSRRTGGA